jgi:multidrug efflux system membrane fusion protein
VSDQGLYGGGGVKGRIASVATGAALIAGGACLWALLYRAAPVATANSPAAEAGVPVTIGIVTATDVPVLLHAIGTVQAFNAITVRSRVDGQIDRVEFVEGEEVEAGAPLFEIDPRPYAAALAQAKAAKDKDAAQLESAELDLERYTKLVVHGIQTRQSFDQQRALVAQLKAAIAGDQAQIDTAQLNLDYTRIRAPVAGRLGARLVDVGNLVRTADGAPLVTITQLRPVFVSFTVPQESLEQVRQQQRASPLAVEAFTADNAQRLAEGRLTLIDNAIDAATASIRMKAQFANADERLWPGQFVNVRVVLGIRRAVATVPAQAVQEGPDGYIVYVVGRDGRAHHKRVAVVAMQDGIAAVSEGLVPGERVVVDGQFRLTDGARVTFPPASDGQGASGAPTADGG